MRYRQLYLLPIVTMLLGACSSIDQLFGCPVPDTDPQSELALHGQLATTSSTTIQDPDAPDASAAEELENVQALAASDHPVPTVRPRNGSCSL